ncbi:MAG: patatin-like phospholipase family protein [Leptolyngbya sp.]|nr:patatin-like phospholipase family protein [Candidatus Melainabacteria bacterium]
MLNNFFVSRFLKTLALLTFAQSLPLAAGAQTENLNAPLPVVQNETHTTNTSDSTSTTRTTTTTTTTTTTRTTQHSGVVTNHPRVIIALGGGGTRGCAHIGVLRVLEKEGIKIDGIAGTSIGAIIGGLYAAGVSLDEIEERILNRSLLKSFQTVPIPVRVAVIPVFFIPHLFGYHPYDGLYKGNRFRNYLNDSVPEGNREIESLKMPFVAVASNLLDAKPYAIGKGNLGRAIQASSAIPVLRRPVVIDDKLLIDGGLQANLPAKQARAMGADIVIAVNVDEQFNKDVSKKSFRKIGSVSHRVINMILAKVDEDQINAADILICPEVNNIQILSSKSRDARNAIAAGEKATKAMVDQIKARISSPIKPKVAEQLSAPE